ncbi:Arylsulfatase B [Eumeta japonica]|uniref:Arylsulfatase B n=1 Tax=Eumeta variegata TaxID=151549 RepID=A0A4C1WC50_EUMVA|nr:Arylsulfatase B [Eumeta japonica]
MDDRMPRACVLWMFLTATITKTSQDQRPNIVFIIADDLITNSLSPLAFVFPHPRIPNFLLHPPLLWLSSSSPPNTASSLSKPTNMTDKINVSLLGWDDVSFHGSAQVLTPNIDLLAYSGAALQRYYTHSQCSPSRAAMLTGKYAHRLGLQGYPIVESEDRGIPLNEKLLPQYLKELGYATHLVGKWHVGHSREAYLPTSRGFDSHFGHRGGFIDYYEYISEETWTTGKVAGFDLYRNSTPAWDVEGYITDIYTEEAARVITSHNKDKPLFLVLSHAAPHAGNDGARLQAPPDVVRGMRHVDLGERRLFAAMVKKLDDSVGQVTETLEKMDMLNNTIIVFVSDNGGMTLSIAQNWGFNWPLRGLKMSPFEGGTRVVGLIWSNAMSFTKNVWEGRMHCVDWLPTLLKAAGGEEVSGIDGLNLWDSITNGERPRRNEHFEIDDYTGYSAVVSGDYKLIIGQPILSHSQHDYGDELRGVIADKVPSYEETLRNSVMYSVLKKIGKPLDMQSVLSKRRRLTVQCGSSGNTNVTCQPTEDKMCLYDIERDPCERNDLSTDLPEVANRLYRMVKEEWDKRIPRTVPMFRDPDSRPSINNYTWTNWKD